MSPEKDKVLCTRYPDLFRGRHKPMTETLMCWGFDCDDGWFELIENLCFAITEYCTAEGVEVPEVVQVKEKFGGLRFYLNGVHNDHFNNIYNLISQAEKQSYKVCEVCGKPGKPNSGGWIKTTCKEHAKE